MPGMFRNRCGHQCPSLLLFHQFHSSTQPSESGFSASCSCITGLEWASRYWQILNIQEVGIGDGIL